MKESFTQVINTRLTDEQLEVLDKRAQELGSSISVALRAIITEYGREHYGNGRSEPEQEQAA